MRLIMMLLLEIILLEGFDFFHDLVEVVRGEIHLVGANRNASPIESVNPEAIFVLLQDLPAHQTTVISHVFDYLFDFTDADRIEGRRMHLLVGDHGGGGRQTFQETADDDLVVVVDVHVFIYLKHEIYDGFILSVRHFNAISVFQLQLRLIRLYVSISADCCQQAWKRWS